MSDFDMVDVVRLSGLRLARAEVIPPEEREKDEKDKSKSQGEQNLKIQMFFYGRRVEKKGDRILNSKDIQKLLPIFGEKLLIKFKLSQEVFDKCRELGLLPGGETEWDAMPFPWSYIEKGTGNKKSGVWYRPAKLITLNGQAIDYQFLKGTTRPVGQDAFTLASKSAGGTPAFPGWMGSLEAEANEPEPAHG